jgi:hypothetical protein
MIQSNDILLRAVQVLFSEPLSLRFGRLRQKQSTKPETGELVVKVIVLCEKVASPIPD